MLIDVEQRWKLMGMLSISYIDEKKATRLQPQSGIMDDTGVKDLRLSPPAESLCGVGT